MTRSLPIALLLLLLAQSTIAVDRQTADHWMGRINRGSELIKEGNYAESARVLEKLTSELCDTMGPGPAAPQLLGTVLLYRALAYEGLGQQDDALWYWYEAQSFYPPLATMDLGSFGLPGQFLRQHPLPPVPEKHEPDGIIPPRVRSRREPQFPAAAHAFHIKGSIVVTVTLSAEGTPTVPRIKETLPAPTLTYAALEALKKWRFDPATRNGIAVPTLFDLTVNYKYKD